MVTSPKPLEGSEIEKILGHGVTIPPQPKVLMEIEQLVEQPQVSVKKVAALIAKDPALLAGVFRVVNSPAMGLVRRIDSVETAISLLGLKQVTNLLKSIAIRQALGGQTQAYEKFWERSGDIAQIAAIIAHKQVSVCNVFPDQAYLAGLFHDCGVPVLMQRFSGYCAGLNAGIWPDLAGEDRNFDTDHSVVGYLVGKHWRLPDFILGGIRYHHEILSVVHPARTVVAMLQMATHIYLLAMKQQDEPEWEACWEVVIEELGIAHEGLCEFEEDVIEEFTAAR
ncbi:MAG: HDOD domain-containing protein [Methylophilaceae bacterium]|nr:HDOD domain-containing protein [Methylophilaceae bacterium]